MKKKVYVAILLCAFAVICLFYGTQSKPEDISMNMCITPAGSPAVVVHIENTPYLVKVDLGSKFALSLSEAILETLTNKKADSIATWRDAKGNFYEAPSYCLPVVKMGSLTLRNILAKQENKEYIANTTLWNDKDPAQVYENEPVGVLGRPILEKTNLLFDFQNSKLTACKNLKHIKDLRIDKMIAIPFEVDAKGIFIMAQTDVGELRLFFDTGATISIINSSRVQDQECGTDCRGFKVYTTQRFQLGNQNLGTKNLYLYDLSPELENIDGALGMDVLSNRVVYVDYPSRMIYLSEKK